MNPHPQQPLDAEERALAAALPRLHGRDQPDSALDARILAAAQQAVQAKPKTAGKRRSWIVPISLAASVTLAVGLTWQLQQPTAAPEAAHEQASLHELPVATVAAIEPADAAAAPAIAPAAAPETLPAPRVAATPAIAAAAQTHEAAPPPAPPAPPSPAAAPAIAIPPPAPQVATATVAREDAIVMQRAKTAGAPPAESLDRSAASASTQSTAKAQATRAEAASVTDAPDEDIPPATMDSPAARDAWLQRIRSLQQQGELDAARASLSEFRRRYPEAKLPDDLRPLEQPAPESVP
ncbi:MAG: hypothetical protein QM612_01015 [Thermomonas sp.]|uniref:hypothetical protein n=1 Tax=Thermomonas sp. TaxID=1971895 RepID=UPI0039E39DFF